MAGMAGAFFALVMGKSEPRAQKRTRTSSPDESLSSDPSSAKDKSKRRCIYKADTGAHNYQQPTEAFDHSDKTVSEIVADHEAQLRHEQEKYAELERVFKKHYRHVLQIKKQRDGLRSQQKEFKRQQSKLWNSYKMTSARYDYVVRETIQPFARDRGMQWDDQTAETISVVLDALTADAIEANTLRDQVRVLQREMLANVDKVQGVSDEQLGREFRNLIALIKTLSRTIQFSPGADIVKLCGTPHLLQGVKPNHWKGRAGKKYLMEAWVWCVLLDLVFQGPFDIFGTAGDDLDTVWKHTFGSHHVHAWPIPSTLCETWRYTTVEQLAGQADLAAVTAGESESATEYSPLELSMSEIREEVYRIIAAQVARVSAPKTPPQISVIVNKAFALALQLSTQRCRLQLTYPLVGAEFHKESMESMPDSDGEDIEKGNVAFIVHPGLTKWGDAHGKNLDHRFDIVSSLVQLEAPEPGKATTEAYVAALKHDTGVSSK